MADTTANIIIKAEIANARAGLSQLRQAVADGNKTVSQAANEMRAYEKTIKDANKVAGQGTSAFGGMFKQFTAGALAAQAATKGIGLLTDFVKDSFNAAIEEEKQWNNVGASLRTVNNISVGTIKQFQAMTDLLEDQTGVADELIANGWNQLIRAGIDVNTQYRLMKIALDASALSGKSLESVLDLVLKGYSGNEKALERLATEFGIVIEKGDTFETILQKIGSTSSGAASAGMEGLAGATHKWEIAAERAQEKFGGLLGKAFKWWQKSVDIVKTVEAAFALKGTPPELLFPELPVPAQIDALSQMIKDLRELEKTQGTTPWRAEMIRDITTYLTALKNTKEEPLPPTAAQIKEAKTHLKSIEDDINNFNSKTLKLKDAYTSDLEALEIEHKKRISDIDAKDNAATLEDDKAIGDLRLAARRLYNAEVESLTSAHNKELSRLRSASLKEFNDINFAAQLLGYNKFTQDRLQEERRYKDEYTLIMNDMNTSIVERLAAAESATSIHQGKLEEMNRAEIKDYINTDAQISQLEVEAYGTREDIQRASLIRQANQNKMYWNDLLNMAVITQEQYNAATKAINVSLDSALVEAGKFRRDLEIGYMEEGRAKELAIQQASYNDTLKYYLDLVSAGQIAVDQFIAIKESLDKGIGKEGKKATGDLEQGFRNAAMGARELFDILSGGKVSLSGILQMLGSFMSIIPGGGKAGGILGTIGSILPFDDPVNDSMLRREVARITRFSLEGAERGRREYGNQNASVSNSNSVNMGDTIIQVLGGSGDDVVKQIDKYMTTTFPQRVKDGTIKSITTESYRSR